MPVIAIGCAGDGASRAVGSTTTPRIGATQIKVVETPTMTIDRIYPSMTGPAERVKIDTSEVADNRELYLIGPDREG